MTRRDAMPDGRGGGDPSRRDAFRYTPRGAVLAIVGIMVLGTAAIVLVAYDVGGARETLEAGWVTLGGLFLILVALGLVWIAWRRPVLLVVGPDGLDLPGAFQRPLPWAGIARIRHTRRRTSPIHRLILLKVELAHGMRLDYKRRLWTMPKLDSWVARRFGLTVPVQNLDAEEEIVIASIERFHPVERKA